eukprot:CAMPEP_0197241908 /NCGR_PEP_ID=MMETSP1429-20130617/7810_1 /TAXON_ID=49237 /ORGANISM="Chaetoceros  sp., Strain UNC1202" /LENGTH=83 /DNA_ID=CAMNT_0042701825 /DNA_START=444 /DNA_END=695 /DNA_ORIENTATION=-
MASTSMDMFWPLKFHDEKVSSFGTLMVTGMLGLGREFTKSVSERVVGKVSVSFSGCGGAGCGGANGGGAGAAMAGGAREGTGI